MIFSMYFVEKWGIVISLGDLGSSFWYVVFFLIFRFLVDIYGVRCDLVFIGKILLNFCVVGILMRLIIFYEDL